MVSPSVTYNAEKCTSARLRIQNHTGADAGNALKDRRYRSAPTRESVYSLRPRDDARDPSGQTKRASNRLGMRKCIDDSISMHGASAACVSIRIKLRR